MKQRVFLSSLEVLLRTINPYLESPIQNGESSSLILERPPSDMISYRSAKPPIDVFHFLPFLFETNFHLQIRDDPSSLGGNDNKKFFFKMHQAIINVIG